MASKSIMGKTRWGNPVWPLRGALGPSPCYGGGLRHTCRGEGRCGALQGGGETTVSAALRALPCASVGVDASKEAFDSKTVLDDFALVVSLCG